MSRIVDGSPRSRVRLGRWAFPRREGRDFYRQAKEQARRCIFHRPLVLPSVVIALLFSFSRAFAEEQFVIEDAFTNPTDVPASIAADLQNNLDNVEKACFTDSKITAQDALEATRVDLGTSVRTLLLKPRIPSDPKAAWGCLCGAYACPMWIYSVEGEATRQIWSSVGVSLEIINRNDKDVNRLLILSGSAGHQSLLLYSWDGMRYIIIREKEFTYEEGEVLGKKSEYEIMKFKEDAYK